jgi:hypothetical protein
MCYNCGCGMLDNTMGSQDNLTVKNFEKAAKSTGQSVKDTKEHVYEALKKELGKK